MIGNPLNPLLHTLCQGHQFAPTINSISSRKQNPNRPAIKHAARFVQLRCCLCVTMSLPCVEKKAPAFAGAVVACFSLRRQCVT